MASRDFVSVLALTEIGDFGVVILAVSATVFVALLGMRLADRLSLPYAALFLVGAAVISDLWTDLQDVLSVRDVERIAVVALVLILFDGGLHIGLGRFRRSLGPILGLGIVGTFLTAGVVAVAAHYVLGFTWIESGLIGAARRSHGSSRHVLGVRRARDTRALGNDPRGRGGRERPRGDRPHDRDDRARLRGGRQPLGRRRGVRDRDGARPRRRDRRCAASPARLPARPADRARALPDPCARGRGNHLRAGRRDRWLRVPRSVRGRCRARRLGDAPQGRDRGLPLARSLASPRSRCSSRSG